MEGFDFLSDTTEQTAIRFVTFISEQSMNRFDLAIAMTNRFYGKLLVTDLQSCRSAIIGPDDLEEEGYLEHAFRLDEEKAQELKRFLLEVVGNITFSDH